MITKFVSFYSAVYFISVGAMKAWIQCSEPLFGKVSSSCQTQNITATLSSLIRLWRQSVKILQNGDRERMKERMNE